MEVEVVEVVVEIVIEVVVILVICERSVAIYLVVLVIFILVVVLWQPCMIVEVVVII